MKILALVCISAVACTAEAKKKPAEKEAVTFKQVTLADATEGLPKDGKLIAEIATEQGKITCELYPDSAPRTVASFVGLARGKQAWKDPKTGEWVKRPYFDGLAFHRVMPNFMIQGGDPLSRDYDDPAAGTGGPGYTLPDEIDDKLIFNGPGRLAMANKGPRTESGGSQFFITEKETPQLDGGYVIFGQCDNVEVVKAIARVPRGSRDKPQVAVRMEIKITRK